MTRSCVRFLGREVSQADAALIQKVRNGCDSRCASCIIPTARGAAESRPMARMPADARRPLGEGHPELVMTGINAMRRSYGVGGHLDARRRAREALPALNLTTAAAGMPGRTDPVQRRHPDGSLTGLGADDTRFVLPAGAGEPGRMVAVAVAGMAGEHLEGRPV